MIVHFIFSAIFALVYLQYFRAFEAISTLDADPLIYLNLMLFKREFFVNCLKGLYGNNLFDLGDLLF